MLPRYTEKQCEQLMQCTLVSQGTAKYVPPNPHSSHNDIHLFQLSFWLLDLACYLKTGDILDVSALSMEDAVAVCHLAAAAEQQRHMHQ